MNRTIDRAMRLGLTICGVVLCAGLANAQFLSSEESGPGASPRNASEMLRQVDLLVQQNAELEKQNRALMSEIGSLRQVLAKQLDETAVDRAGGEGGGDRIEFK